MQFFKNLNLIFKSGSCKNVPCKRSGGSFKWSGSPFKLSGGPFKRSGGPFKQLGGPFKRSGGPFKQVGCLFKRSGGPFKQLGGPFKRSGGPFKRLGGPFKRWSGFFKWSSCRQRKGVTFNKLSSELIKVLTKCRKVSAFDWTLGHHIYCMIGWSCWRTNLNKRMK